MSDVLISEETLERFGNGFRSAYGSETLYTTEQMITLASENRLQRLLSQSLDELSLADMRGMTKIRKFQFQRTKGLQRINIPDTVTEIGCEAFNYCTDLIEITIPDSVIVTEWSTFLGCESLQTAVIGNGVSVIGSSDFEDCIALTHVTIGTGVKTIGISAFRGCTALESIIIPNNVTTLSGTAFQNCQSLTDVTIGEGVTNIGSQTLAVGYDNRKATLRFLRTSPPTIQADTFHAPYLNKIIVPSGCSAVYKNATNWSNFASYIVEG